MAERKKLFGTDGVRGTANVWPMTGEMAMAIGKTVAHVLQTKPELHGKTSLPVGIRGLEASQSTRRAKIVIGKDTRLSGYMLEQALASGVLSMGADVILIGPLSTPGVAYITHSIRADAGIMISASHNSYEDNGIKIFSADGFKLPDSLEEEIERIVSEGSLANASRPTGDLVGKAFRLEDVHYRYVVFLKSSFADDLDLIGMKVAIDCANGAAYKTAPLVFEELGAEVVKTGISPNGLNINQDCGALHPSRIAETVKASGAQIGISLDGDGDRCILADEKGEVVDGDQIIGLCAIEMHRAGKLDHATIVTTPMSNIGLELSLKEHGISMMRAKVGDRHVVEMMRSQGYKLGGEQSGHIVFLNSATTGDGILAALKVLEVMKRTGKPLSELKKQIRLFPQVLENIRVRERRPIEDVPGAVEAIANAEKRLAGKGRVFVRYSGTEPLLRIMVEGEDHPLISELAQSIAQVFEKEVGKA
jgi:phosphoglucosamine mutase